MYFIVLIPLLFLFVRYSSILRVRYYDTLNSVGIKISDRIWTPLTKLEHVSPYWFDLVLIGRHNNALHGYLLFHQQYFTIPLHHVPVGYKLNYLEEGVAKDYPYYPGTPVHLKEGILVLYQNRRKGLGFRLMEVARSTEWPIQVNKMETN